MQHLTCLSRILALVTLGLLVACGGGGSDDGCPAGPDGDYALAVDADVVCASDLFEVWRGDVVFLPPNEIRLLLHLPEASGCCPETIEMRGVEIGAGSFAMDDLPERFVCALGELYAYEAFGIRNATLTLDAGGFQLTGSASVVSGAACLGPILIDGDLDT